MNFIQLLNIYLDNIHNKSLEEEQAYTAVNLGFFDCSNERVIKRLEDTVRLVLQVRRYIQEFKRKVQFMGIFSFTYIFFLKKRSKNSKKN